MKLFTLTLIGMGLLLFKPANLRAQTASNGITTNGSNSGYLPAAMPFLTIAPDSRSAGMGDAGVALSPDANANYWNPSKLSFLEDKDNVSLSYSPWLRKLVSDVNLAYLSYAHKIDERSTLGASLRYFNLGSIQLTDINQADLGTYRPSELALDASYARRFGESFALGITFRYMHSGLASATVNNNQTAQSASAFAADISAYYHKPMQQFGKRALLALGLCASNMGSKVRYSQGGPQYFLPANLRIGAADTWYLDELNELTLTLDLNKLMVPTPPILDAKGNIIEGYDDNRSIPAGIFGSFADAPGGFSEEMKEISYAGGVEYGYKKQFFVRAGYFYENPAKGNRQYLTLGAGFKYDIFKLDLSYLAASQQKSALANTLRFTVSATFDKKR